MREADGSLSVGMYRDGVATPVEIATAMARLRQAFPRMGDMFFNLLAERVVAHGLTGERLRDSVDKAIDGHPYGSITVADIIGHDRKIRLYTYREVCAMVFRGEALMEEYPVYMEIDGVTYRARRSDAAMLALGLTNGCRERRDAR